jgi:fermentation-respiration switch protein FrsA (DUF1100 family)
MTLAESVSATAAAIPRAQPRVGAEPASANGSLARAELLTPRMVLLVVLGLSATYFAWHLGRGWIPNDDGSLAHSAERVLQGELPHRDFDDIYTGGLAVLNAAAFRLFGTTLWTLRLVLFAVFLAWVPAIHAIAGRFVRPMAAGAVTLLAVVWSLPNYPAAMPSWYNLFLATFGILALLKHLEDRRQRWLVAAGVAGGLSFLVKVIGLYYVAGVLLFLVFHAQEEGRAGPGPHQPRGTAYAIFVSVALLLFVAALAALVREHLRAPEVVHFLVPAALIAGLLVRGEWTAPAGTSTERFGRLARLVAPFLLGVALPIALFLVPYVRAGAVGDFVHGVFVLPTKRLGVTELRMPSLWTALALLPLGVLARHARRPLTRRESTLLIAALVLLLLASRFVAWPYLGVWSAARNLVPALVLVGVMVLARRRGADEGDPLLRRRMLLLLSVTALCSLVQFPFASPVYFLYVAPLVVLSTLALVRYLRPASSAVPRAVTAFYLAFAIWLVNTSSLYGMGTVYRPYYRVARLAPERSGGALEIGRVQSIVYNYTIALLLEHARGGYTWASPDCPEIYFLSGLRNPTRSLFEFFDEPVGRTERVLRALEQHGVTAIVMNATPGFSPRISDELAGALAQRYPQAERVGNFLVRWQP